MIVVRAPLRISFVGGGTDLPDFYHKHPGRVISATIDKYVYLVVNPTPMIPQVSARYSVAETVDHPSQLEHSRLKAALLDAGITSNIEIGSFASVPAKTGLGSSSSFSVALVKALNLYKGKKLSAIETAEEACRLEIGILKEPIGKQDQYASAIGGFNIFEFHQDEKVTVKPVLLGYQAQSTLEDHALLFFTGITRSASDVLAVQRTGIDEKIEQYKAMADMVPEFEQALLSGDSKRMGDMLHEGWLMKKSLSSNISSSVIDTLYEEARKIGAWGGKILGAGGGGCLLFLAPREAHEAIRAALSIIAGENNLTAFREIPVKFVQSGAEVLFNDNHGVL